MLVKKIAYNTVVQILGKIVGFFISGALLVVVASRLGTYGMGNYVTITAFVGFFVTLSDLGANLIMVRDISQNEKNREAITGEFLGFRLTFSFLTMALAPLIALLIPQYSLLIIQGTIIAALAQFLLLVNQMFISMLQTQLMLDKAVFAELSNRLITLGTVLLAVHFGVTGTSFFFAVLYATLIGAVFNTLITFFFARKLWAIIPRIDFSSWKKTFKVIGPIGIYTFLGMVHFKADTIILSLLKGPIDVGIYGYAYKIGEIIFTFPVMFVGATFPKLSQLLLHDKEKFNRFAQLSLDALFIGTIPFLTFVFLASKYFTLVLSSASFHDGLEAGLSLQILTFAFLAWFIGTLFIHILIMANDYIGLIRNLAIAVVLNIVLNLLLIPHFSYLGAASVTVITEFIMLALTLLYMRSRVGFRPQLRFIGSVIGATVVMAFVLWRVTQLPVLAYTSFFSYGRFEQLIWLCVLAGGAAIVYVALLGLFKGRALIDLFKNGKRLHWAYS